MRAANPLCPRCRRRFYWRAAEGRKPLPPGVWFERLRLGGGATAYAFVDATLGPLGHVVVQSASGGDWEVTSNPAPKQGADPALARRRRDKFETIAADLMRVLEALR
jgi:hypothetical protein